jgi:arabinofuranosyltransferase
MNTLLEEPEYTQWQKRLLIAGLAFIIAIFFVTAAGHLSYTPDDTFIYLQYARNIAQGHGFSFNAGEATYGTTSPLWTLLLASMHLFPNDAIFAAKALDLFTASLALVMFFLLAVEILRNRLVALLATLVFSMNLTFLRWSSSGMETSLSVFLVLAVFRYCYRNEYFIGAFFAGLLALVRPEAVFLFGAISAEIFTNTIERRNAIRTFLISLVVFLGVVLPWYLYAFGTFGTIIPNTALAKGGIVGNAGHIVWTITASLKIIGASDILTVLFFIAGLVLVIRKKNETAAGGYTEIRFLVMPIVWIGTLLLVYIGTSADVVSRYLLLILPLITILGFWGVQKIQARFTILRNLGYSLFVIFAAIILIQNQIIYHRTVLPHARDFSNGSENTLRFIAVWCSENTPPDAIIAAPDIGMLGYYSHRKICDPRGLITPEFIPLIHSGLSYSEIMEKKLYRTICTPDYVIDRADVADRLTDDDCVPLFHRAFYGISISNPDVVYYTVYRVKHDVQPKAFLNRE